jgi:hypothetical protein
LEDVYLNDAYSELVTHEEGDTTPPGVNIGDTQAYPADENNFTLYVLHNEEYIYVGFDVVDNDLAFDENETQAWNNDSLELYIDGNLSRSATKDGNAQGFQATVSGNARLIGGNDNPGADNVLEGDGYKYSEAGEYWNFGNSVKDTEDGWITEYEIDKSIVLVPENREYIGFDVKYNGSEPGAGTRTSNWAYWFTDYNGVTMDGYWNNETGWATVKLLGQEPGVADWALF